MKITEKDLKDMVCEAVRTILKERRKIFGTQYGRGKWYPSTDKSLAPYISELPEELEGDVDFEVSRRFVCTPDPDPCQADERVGEWELNDEELANIINRIENNEFRSACWDSLKSAFKNAEIYDIWEDDDYIE